MSTTFTGEVKQWSDLRPSKYRNFNRGVLVDDTWFNFYSKDATYLQNLHMQFPSGSRVTFEYDETKGYKPVSKIELAGPVEKQLQVTDAMTGKKMTHAESTAQILQHLNNAKEFIQLAIKLLGEAST